ncbi:carbon monoxide dehydrogenase subunit G [Streptomyces sp. NRRL WC-3742]|uniref:carbon monoxide dehydrogenase subunit G n=1 Tax=Streptomyces sp. NRRL WC-3742 TaxID=1463934 RepID=UPI00131C0DCD|nr:carbon monoxide dehydrogenase subunit G [Streptomyces sp. NRRL WC-3742]
MEHEVVVPMPAGLVRQAMQEPARLARSVPGLSTEPAAVGSGPAEEIGGRLKLRIGGSTITYKGVLSLIEGREGVLTVFAEGQEARGGGEATATVRVSVGDGPEDGTAVIRFTGDLSATGRLAEFDAETLEAAGRRLLDRFSTALAGPGEAPEESEEEESGDTAAEESGTEAGVVYLDQPGEDLDDDLSDLIAFSDADAEGFGLPTGSTDDEDEDGAEGTEDSVAEELTPEPLFAYEEEPPVRRSIVGRSAEEVDHAPPRGRYAPAPPARSARARAASRWGGEAGGIVVPGSDGRNALPWVIGGSVALLGGAVVLVRALRRR